MRNLFNDSILMQTIHKDETNDTLLVLLELIVAHATYINSESEYIALAGQLFLKLHGVGKPFKPNRLPTLVTLMDDVARVDVDVLSTKAELIHYFKFSNNHGPVPLAALREFGYMVAAVYNQIFDIDAFLEDGYIDLSTFQVYIDEDKLKLIKAQFTDVTYEDDVLTTSHLGCTVKENNFFTYSVALRRFD